MIELVFIANNREVIIYRIENKVITYLDRIWQNGLRIMPMGEQYEALAKSNQPVAKIYAKLIADANSGKNLEEWKQAQSDEELAEIIRREAALNGLVEVRR